MFSPLILLQQDKQSARFIDVRILKSIGYKHHHQREFIGREGKRRCLRNLKV